jgi:hypothetical protein
MMSDLAIDGAGTQVVVGSGIVGIVERAEGRGEYGESEEKRESRYTTLHHHHYHHLHHHPLPARAPTTRSRPSNPAYPPTYLAN